MSSFLLALGTSLLSGASPVHSLTLGRSASTPFSWISPPVPARGNHLLPGGGGLVAWRGFGERPQKLCVPPTTFCALQLTHVTRGGGGVHASSRREGMQAAPILVPLSQHQLLSPFLTPTGVRGLSRSMLQ